MTACPRMHLTGIMSGKESVVYAVMAILIHYCTGKSHQDYPPVSYSFEVLPFSHFCICHIVTDVGTCARAQNVPMSWSKLEESVQCVVHQ